MADRSVSGIPALGEHLAHEILPGCSDEDYVAPEFSIVIFGGGGDLAKKKLFPTLFHLFKRKYLPERFSVIAAGSPKDTNDAQFREILRAALKEHAAADYDEALFESFAPHVHFKFLRFEDNTAFGELKTLIDRESISDADGKKRIVYYLSVPPIAFRTVTGQLKAFGLNDEPYSARIIIEKPFGEDLASSIELNDAISHAFREEQIYRIDHYLGKETVQNLIFFRFANAIFEPLWNHRYIDNVQITVAEDIGIESRGKFYEQAGVIRDIIQNHAMQLVALVAMEPPLSFDPERVRDEIVKAIRSIHRPSKGEVFENTVVGQYGEGKNKNEECKAYRSEDFVAPDSVTPTFFAGKFFIDNWRWSGVPFYVRAGKRLSKRVTDIVIQFKQPPLMLFGDCQNNGPCVLTLSIQPEESITLRYGVKYPNSIKLIEPVSMKFSYGEQFAERPLPPYARLILDCLKGDLTLFVRQDGIEALWEIADPILAAYNSATSPAFPNYASGSQGPQASLDMLKKDGRKWQNRL